MSFQPIQTATQAVRANRAFQRIADRLGVFGLLLIGLATAGATALAGA